MSAVPLPPTLPYGAGEFALSAAAFNERAVEAEQARLAASFASANSRIHEARLLEQDAASRTAAYRAHLIGTSHATALTQASRAALDVDKNSQALIHSHAQLRSAEQLHTATIAKRNQAEMSLMMYNQETMAVRDMYAQAEMTKNTLSVEARVHTEKAVATEAGVRAAHQHEERACRTATEAAKAAAELRVRLSEAEAVIEEIEVKRSNAAVTAAHASIAAREALAREKEANDVLESISREAEKARTSAALIRAEANLAEENARVKAAGHAAARAGLGEASKIHEEQTFTLAEVTARLMDSQNSALQIGTELDGAVTRETLAQQDLQGSVLEQEKAREAELMASDLLFNANATLAASEELLRRAGSHEAIERANMHQASRIAVEEEAVRAVRHGSLEIARISESMARAAEMNAAVTAATAAESLRRATQSASPSPAILSPAGRIIGSPVAAVPFVSPRY